MKKILDKDKNWKIITLKLFIILFILVIILCGLFIDKKINSYNSLIDYFEDFDYFYIDNEIILDISNFDELNNTIYFGDENASITIFEFIDYQSVFSRKYYKKNYDILKEKYIESGLVKYVLVDNPMPKVHKDSLFFANAMYCSNEQNLSSQVHNLILSRRLNKDEFQVLINSIPLNHTQFYNCTDSQKYELNIIYGVEYSKNNQITKVPTLIIDDVKIEGMRSQKDIIKIIEKKLSEK